MDADAARMSTLSEWAERVRARVDIVEVISEYVALRPAGRSYKGLCPFHAEKTPSFTVSPDRQLYYCFGCGAGGNVFTFLMKLKGLSFTEALLQGAERAGLAAEVERALSGGRPGGRSTLVARLAEANRAAAGFFAEQLWRSAAGEAARAYLHRRGLSPELARQFQLGYAPDQWHGLEQALGRMGFAPAELEQAGLVVAREGGGQYDRFRGRLMFAVADPRGQVVGFGGRALVEGQEPKYLNSPETPVYQKGRLLYGLDRAREFIRRSGRAVVVEGYMDVLAMHQFGLGEAVATCGTSLTPEHGRLLGRFTGQVVVAFDADAAGQAAALRGLQQLRGAGLDVRVAVLPHGHDPDSLLRAEGRPAMEAVLADARGVYEFAIERALAGCEVDTPAGKAGAAANVLPILAEVPSEAERSGLIQLAARLLRMPDWALRREFFRYQASRGRAGRAGGSAAARAVAHGGVSLPYTSRGTRARAEAFPAGRGAMLEQALLKLLLEVPELVQRVAGKLRGEDFVEPAMGALFEGLVKEGSRVLSDPQMAEAAVRVLSGSEVLGPPHEIEGYVRELRVVAAERRLAGLEAQIQQVVREASRGGGGGLEALAELVVSYRNVRERLHRGSLI